VTVVDVSVDALATLLRRASESQVHERVTALQGDAESLAQVVAGRDFDLVLAHEVLESVSNTAVAVAEIAAVLRPGGMTSLLVGNPVAVVLGRALAGDLTGALEAYRHPFFDGLTIDALVRDCAQAGLYVESVEGIGVFSDLVPGVELERPGALSALADLELVAATRAPFRDIAARLHVTARRPPPALRADSTESSVGP
jgi:SAM-dependent methyltransferase